MIKKVPPRTRLFAVVAACLSFVIVASLMMQTLQSGNAEQQQQTATTDDDGGAAPIQHQQQQQDASDRERPDLEQEEENDRRSDRISAAIHDKRPPPKPQIKVTLQQRTVDAAASTFGEGGGAKTPLSSSSSSKKPAPKKTEVTGASSSHLDRRDQQSITDFTDPESAVQKAKRSDDYKEFSRMMLGLSDRDTGVEVEGEGGAQVQVKESDVAYQILQVVNPVRRAPLIPPPGFCPHYKQKFGKDADSKVSLNAIYKYTQYTHKYCNTTGMLQMHFGLPEFLRFADIIAGIVGIGKTPGMKVFELGSGCGTMLNYFGMKYGTFGTGIDLTEDAVTHSRWHARPFQAFCRLDATQLRFFPSDHFDAIVSWAVLYHVRRTWVQCSIMTQLARMLKPGASMYIGHLRTEKTQLFWKRNKCKIPGATWRRMLDYVTFKVTSFRRHGFFSVYLKKFTVEEQKEHDEKVTMMNKQQRQRHHQNISNNSTISSKKDDDDDNDNTNDKDDGNHHHHRNATTKRSANSTGGGDGGGDGGEQQHGHDDGDDSMEELEDPDFSSD